jgi:hypothetical protein
MTERTTWLRANVRIKGQTRLVTIRHRPPDAGHALGGGSWCSLGGLPAPIYRGAILTGSRLSGESTALGTVSCPVDPCLLGAGQPSAGARNSAQRRTAKAAALDAQATQRIGVAIVPNPGGPLRRLATPVATFARLNLTRKALI